MEEIILTPVSIEEIAHLVAEKATDITYEVHFPEDDRKFAAKGASLYWAKVVENEDQYIDETRDSDAMEDLIEEAGLNLEDLADNNSSLRIDLSNLPNGDLGTASMDDFKIALQRAIISDLGSAWSDAVREAIVTVCGIDPQGGGDGLTFPGQN